MNNKWRTESVWNWDRGVESIRKRWGVMSRWGNRPQQTASHFLFAPTYQSSFVCMFCKYVVSSYLKNTGRTSTLKNSKSLFIFVISVTSFSYKFQQAQFKQLKYFAISTKTFFNQSSVFSFKKKILLHCFKKCPIRIKTKAKT